MATLEGGQYDDTLLGSRFHDLILAHGGNDFVMGGDGADTIFGQEGEDILYGGNGADTTNIRNLLLAPYNSTIRSRATAIGLGTGLSFLTNSDITQSMVNACVASN